MVVESCIDRPSLGKRVRFIRLIELQDETAGKRTLSQAAGVNEVTSLVNRVYPVVDRVLSQDVECFR